VYALSIHCSSSSDVSNWRWIAGSASASAAIGNEVIPLESVTATTSRGTRKEDLGRTSSMLAGWLALVNGREG